MAAAQPRSPPPVSSSRHVRRTSRHSVHPLPRSLTARENDTPRRGVFADAWARLDRVQELGADGEGHSGCVNALSWSDDGGILLSGSDDKRICIWTADTRPTAPAADLSPHPLRLSQTIITGHRQNIFSARFLPNASTPTIVSCAGDRDVRVFEVERLQPADSLDFRVRRARGALWGQDGPGVRVLRCHTDRTKRIATEASPFLFLTVSEDGTVRQHDLRRPHECRDECPDPLFRAPAGVDLYSLSISPLTPHLFAVAGQTDCAYICDRRKPTHQTPSWGTHTRHAEQVTCVRRLVLPDSEWESVERRNRIYSERHITCVKMSPDNAGEVICAFARHSTSLFSLNDSPPESSARVRHNSVIPPGPNSNTRRAERDESGPRTRSATARAAETQTPAAPKRRISNLSRPESRPTARQRTDSDPPVSGPIPSIDEFLRSNPTSPQREGTCPSPPAERESRPLGQEWEEGSDEVIDLSEFVQRREDGSEEGSAADNANALVPSDDDADVDEEEDMDIDEEDEEDDFDGEDMFDDTDDDDFGMYRSGARSGEGEFRGVDVVYPRRSFRGARNVDTVKDCNFLGDRSDKVASGSDDGNWFVWDKESGKLEGIYRGDSDIVNVMEQHPTLPLVAVSGIDNTVKMFAPTAPQRGRRSYNRTSHADRIIADNLTGPTYRPASIVPNASAIHFLQSMMRGPHATHNRETVLDLFRSIGIVPMVADSDDESGSDGDASGASGAGHGHSEGDGDGDGDRDRDGDEVRDEGEGGPTGGGTRSRRAGASDDDDDE